MAVDGSAVARPAGSVDSTAMAKEQSVVTAGPEDLWASGRKHGPEEANVALEMYRGGTWMSCGAAEGDERPGGARAKTRRVGTQMTHQPATYSWLRPGPVFRCMQPLDPPSDRGSARKGRAASCRGG